MQRVNKQNIVIALLAVLLVVNFAIDFTDAGYNAVRDTTADIAYDRIVEQSKDINGLEGRMYYLEHDLSQVLGDDWRAADDSDNLTLVLCEENQTAKYGMNCRMASNFLNESTEGGA